MIKLSSLPLSLLLWVMTNLLVAASVMADDSPQDVEEALQRRVTQYWDATLVSDWATTYRMELRSRDSSDPLDPMSYYKERQGKVRYLSIKVDKIEQTGDKAVVRLNGIEMKPLAGRAFGLPRFIESRWQRVDGEWYQVEWKLYVPEEVRKAQQERREAAQAAAEAACRESPENCPPAPEEAAPIQPADQAPVAIPPEDTPKGQ